MCDLSDAISSIGDFFSSPSVAGFQQAAPLLLPAAGAGIGALAGGGKGALEGGLAGLAGGQLVGTGPNTLGSLFSVPSDQSLLGSVFNSSGTPVGSGYGGSALPSASTVTAAGPTDAFGFGSGGLGSGVVTNDIGGGAGSTTFGGGGGYGSGGGGVSSGPGGGGGGTADTSKGGFLDFIKKNPGLLLGLGGIGAELLRGTPSIPQVPALQSEANQLKNQGSQLESAITTGKLPPGAQSIVDSTVASGIAAVRSNYANMFGGGPSTMETTAEQQVRQEGAKLSFNIAKQMADLGLSETQTSSQILEAIMREQLAQDQGLQNAIIGFAQAAGGGFRPIATNA